MMVEKKQSADGKNQIQVKNHIEVESDISQRENRIKQKYMMDQVGEIQEEEEEVVIQTVMSTHT